MNARQQKIIALLNQAGQVSAMGLAERMNVSIETIRRDLKFLAKQGEIHRIHGGAICRHAKDVGNSFQKRRHTYVEAKQTMAKMAIDYVFEGAVISLDASSSSWFFAKMMPNIPCTVVTNSMHNIRALVNKDKIKVIATGGVYSAKYNAFYGPLAESLLQRLHIDIGIFSCTGLDNQGYIWESNELNASMKRRMFKQCQQTFLLIDHSKLGQKNLIHWLELRQASIWFTDVLPEKTLQAHCCLYDVLIASPK